ncbi:MAG TPA: NmrA family NAD(P)-binding protein [Mycobacterium sp.]|nr:NmrA family NAD(P)-binding protein [Mycobacterium sp.]
MRILMVGATGANAGLVLPQLIKRGVVVRALARNDQRAAAARANGAAETAIGDLTDPSSLPAALEDVDGVFHIGPAFAEGEAEMGVAIVNAANAAGARKFVFSGVIHPSISAMANHAAKLAVEEALYTSDLDFTVLQPAMFMQNLAPLWPDIRDRGRLALPYSERSKVCWVDYRDVAEVAAMAFTDDRLSRGTFELCAPGLVDRVQMASMVGDVLDRPVSAEVTPLHEFASTLPEGPQRDGLTRMMAHYDQHGFTGGNGLVLRAILGREPRSLLDYFRELAASPPPGATVGA